MEYFLYSVDLPFSNVKLFYRELNCKELLTLSKINLYFSSEIDGNSDYLTAVQKIVINCIENKKDFYKITIIDYFLFLIKLRTVSIGNELKLESKAEENDNMSFMVNLDLDLMLKSIYESSNELIKNGTISYKNIKIKLDWPNIKTETFFVVNAENIELLVPEFINSIEINNKKIEFKTLNYEEKNNLYYKLPLKLKNLIEKKVIFYNKQMENTNFFNIKRMEDFKISLCNQFYCMMVRYLFFYDLSTFYQEYYLLASKNIDLSYVDKMSLSDKTVFCSLVEKEYDIENKRSYEFNEKSEERTDLQDLISEFEG